MACRQSIGTEILGRCQKVGELDGLIARHAGDRCLAGDVAFGERIDHSLAEAFFVVEDIVRDAEGFRNPARVLDILARTAGTGAMGGRAMVVELQGYADDIIALALEETGDDGGINAARHGNDNARVFWASGKVQAVHHVSSEFRPQTSGPDYIGHRSRRRQHKQGPAGPLSSDTCIRRLHWHQVMPDADIRRIWRAVGLLSQKLTKSLT